MNVAEVLNLSETSIKRMFAEEYITLKRLDKIMCTCRNKNQSS